MQRYNVNDNGVMVQAEDDNGIWYHRADADREIDALKSKLDELKEAHIDLVARIQVITKYSYVLCKELETLSMGE